MKIEIVEEAIERRELIRMGEEGFGDMIKAVVDIEREIMAIGGELHADGEAILLGSGSRQENLWGINFYPQKGGDEFIEFDSVINLKPMQGNRSRGIEDPHVRKRIKEIAEKLIKV